ncbi:MAG: XTP/dITP diphosphatase [Candidatus Lokiarchaeota archaeon]|nr:XTP/dITP diphosphatase [Candidatus Lokiarchaeota archaeon]
MNNDENTVYFVTGNKFKFQEVSEIFKDKNMKYDLKQRDIKTTEIQAHSLREVALFKLNSVKNSIDGSFFIEDAGFFIDSPLKGFPGVYSSYVLKTIGNEGILKLIDDFELSKAHFSAIIAFYHKFIDKILFFEGNVEGRVSNTIRGKGGFGFDPIFIPNILPDKTFAELSAEEKNKISHRGQAFTKLLDYLEKK